jgi:hypothetical protein
MSGMSVHVTGVRATGPCSRRWTLEAHQGAERIWCVVDSTPPRRGRIHVFDVRGFDAAPVTLALRLEAERAVQQAARTWRDNAPAARWAT